MPKLNHTVRSNRIKTTYGSRKSYWQGGSGKHTEKGEYVDFGQKVGRAGVLSGMRDGGTKKQGYRDLRTTKKGAQRDYYRELRERNANIDGYKAEALETLKRVASELGTDLGSLDVDFNRIYGYENDDVERINAFMREVYGTVSDYEQDLAMNMAGMGIDPYNITMSDGTNYGELINGVDAEKSVQKRNKLLIELEELGRYF